MKNLILNLIFLTSTAAFGMQSTLCETYAETEDRELTSVYALDPSRGVLSTIELGMIQATVSSYDSSRPYTMPEALEIFTDAAHSGSNGGALNYETVQYKGRTEVVVRSVFFPGGNEYGALFRIVTARGEQTANLIGTIEDSEVYCLKFSGI